MKRTEIITYNEIDLYVTGYYHEAVEGDYENPPEAEEFNIEKIKLGNYDITTLFTDEQLEEIEEQILND
jgi:hypothetical protein